MAESVTSVQAEEETRFTSKELQAVTLNSAGRTTKQSTKVRFTLLGWEVNRERQRTLGLSNRGLSK